MRGPLFTRLQTRLTVLYAAMFGIVLLALSCAVYLAAAQQAKAIASNALSSSGEVFDRVWALRAERLQSGAAVLSRDFGFREALASKDAPTIESAVDNLRARLELDSALVVDPEGRLIAGVGRDGSALAQQLRAPLAASGAAKGIVVAAGAPVEVVSAPILAPDLKGFIVFAVRLDAAQMQALTRLSAVSLTPVVVWREAGDWKGGHVSTAPGRLSRFIDRALADPAHPPGVVTGNDGALLTLARPLAVPEGAPDAALVLTYPLAAALAPYRGLLWVIVGVGLMGLALVVAGSWGLARDVTRPLSKLAEAARRLREGESVQIEVVGRDEVGALSADFNAMAEAVAERERRISRAALTDDETELANRPALEQAARALSRNAGAKRVFVAAFGVDRYSRMRGVVGYAPAAELLRTLGAQLSERRPDWRLARTSTDVVAATFLATDEAQAARWVLEARDRLQGAHSVGEHVIDVAVSVGLSTGAADEALIPQAELALDAARAEAAPLKLYDRDSSRRAGENLRLMPDLRRALKNDALSLVHQPKYDVRLQRITGVECLVRWTHPDLGPIPPDRFVAIAEETGDIRALTDWVLDRAVADQAQMVRAGHDLCFSINLSGRLVGDDAFTTSVLDRLSAAQGPICLEITETAMMGSPEAAMASVARFAEAGVGVSLDDYGTGLCALGYLKRLAATELKLDRSLVKDVQTSARDALLVRSTVDLAHGLGMKVVAEGVEEELGLTLLAGMGCDLIQGYLISRPLTLGALQDFLSEPMGVGRALSA
ncbi:EAL domain-containing protein [soil metagenome]